jgi:hypothetical protein
MKREPPCPPPPICPIPCSYQRLLAASRNWIRQEDFEAAIHRALDNPQPFGFITNLPVSKGF